MLSTLVSFISPEPEGGDGDLGFTRLSRAHVAYFCLSARVRRVSDSFQVENDGIGKENGHISETQKN